MIDAKQVGQAAEALFDEGYNCCEAVSVAVVKALGCECRCLPGLATGMGGGVGHTGHICGAVSGGAMALGLGVSRMGLKSHGAEKEMAVELVSELVDAFGREFNYVACGDLIGIDFGSPGWQAEYRDKGCRSECSRFVGFVGQWVATRLAAEGS
ncbi:MAG: hypothetical protein GWP05_10315 [Anaerolineaceae bacterium]|nr:hypothetical protein [Anaerolineaceae bacterium]